MIHIITHAQDLVTFKWKTISQREPLQVISIPLANFNVSLSFVILWKVKIFIAKNQVKFFTVKYELDGMNITGKKQATRASVPCLISTIRTAFLSDNIKPIGWFLQSFSGQVKVMLSGYVLRCHWLSLTLK